MAKVFRPIESLGDDSPTVVFAITNGNEHTLALARLLAEETHFTEYEWMDAIVVGILRQVGAVSYAERLVGRET